MAKTIEFDYENQHYVLEYNRRSVEVLESRGFNLADIDSKPMLTLPRLFEGAFIAHHRFVKKNVIDKIYEAMPNKDELFENLVEMYQEPINTLVEEPDEKGKNIDWTVSS